MQIHELNALGRSPASGDQLVIDTGELTAKLDYDALANAIVNALAVKKTGDTMSGDLQINKSLPAVYLATSGITRAYMRHNGTGKYLQFVQFNPDNGKYENYYFPVANSETDVSYNILTSKIPVTIAQGGTGVDNISDLLNVVFSNVGTVTSYPTKAGIHHVGGTLFAGLPSTAGRYGLLVIMRNLSANYQMHLYLDSNNQLFFGFSYTSGGSNIVAPSSWRAVSATSVSPAT